MSPVHQISRAVDDDAYLSKMRRSSYAGWKQRVEAARERERQHMEAQAWKQNRI